MLSAMSRAPSTSASPPAVGTSASSTPLVGGAGATGSGSGSSSRSSSGSATGASGSASAKCSGSGSGIAGGVRADLGRLLLGRALDVGGAGLGGLDDRADLLGGGRGE